MKINHTALVEHVAAEAGVSPKVVGKVLRAFFDVVGRKVTEGHSVNVTNFGTWTSTIQPERLAHNPQTMEPMVLSERRRARFVFAPAFRKAVVSGVVPATLRKRGSR
jgi:DNA-binding protein HU-beta